MNVHDRYYTRLAAAFVRGRRAAGYAVDLSIALRSTPLGDLTPDELAHIFQRGERAGLRLHKFKRTLGLPRVDRVLGLLKGLQPASLLDIGSGRGVFLWPLLDAFPELPVTCLDRDLLRIEDLTAVQAGGVENLNPVEMDVLELDFEPSEFDVVTMLEVLEHLPHPQQALERVVETAARFVVLSVPSQPDDNPEHLHLFNQQSLDQMFTLAGARRVQYEHVRGHLLAIANAD